MLGWKAMGVLVLFLLSTLVVTSAPVRATALGPQTPMANPYVEVNYTLGNSVTGSGYGVAFDAADGSFYVVNAANLVEEFNESTWKLMGSLTVTSGKYAHLAVDPIHDLGFVNGGASGDITMFNTSTRAVLKTLVVTGGSGISIDPIHEILQFQNGPVLSLFDYATWSYLANITMPTIGQAVAFDPANDWIGVLFTSATSVPTIGFVNESTRQWAANVSLPSNSIGVAFDPTGNDFVVGEGADISVVHLIPSIAINNYTIPSPQQNVIGVATIGGGADEALLWEYANAGGATLQPFDLSRGVFLTPVLFSSNAWPAAIAVDPRSEVALGIDSITGYLAPYLPVQSGRTSVTFQESGLQAGTDWCVTLNSTPACSTSYAQTFHEGPGSESYSVSPVAGYSVSPSSGSVTVTVISLTVSITFTPKSEVNFAVNFTESGLPAGTNWSVTFNWATLSAKTASLSFQAPNGSYGFTVAAVTGYGVVPGAGTVTVAGKALNQSIVFSVYKGPTYPVNFTESGLPTGTNWSVTLGSLTRYSLNASIDFSAGNGTYGYAVGAVTGYTVSPSSGSLTVSGKPIATSVQYTPVGVITYNVSFLETGLPGGTTWSVNLNGVLKSFAGTTISFVEPVGSYSYTIASVGTYTAAPSNGTVSVSNTNMSISVTFSQVATSWTVTFAESGLPGSTAWWVDLAGNNITTVNPTLTYAEPNGNYGFTAGGFGYLATPSSGSLLVSGQNISQTITFTPQATKYLVSFSESGLPTGTSWTVVLSGTSQSAVAPASISFTEPDGTYSFTVNTVSGYLPTPDLGSLTVSGQGVTQNIVFAQQSTYTVSFTETGLNAGNFWWVQLVGQVNQTATAPSGISFQLPNGDYRFSAGGPTNYAALPPGGSVLVSSGPTSQVIQFSYAPVGSYLVDFMASNLPGGASWSVTMGGSTRTSSQSSDPFYEPNGSWSFTVNPPSGYSASPSSGGAQVRGSPQDIFITFAQVSSSSSNSTQSTPLLGGSLLDLVWIAGIVGAGVVAVLLTRPRRDPPAY